MSKEDWTPETGNVVRDWSSDDNGRSQPAEVVESNMNRDWSSDDNAAGAPRDWSSDNNNGDRDGDWSSADAGNEDRDWSSDGNDNTARGDWSSDGNAARDWSSDDNGRSQQRQGLRENQPPPEGPPPPKEGNALVAESIAESLTRVVVISRDPAFRQHAYSLAGASNYEEFTQRVESRVAQFLAKTPKPPPKKRPRKK